MFFIFDFRFKVRASCWSATFKQIDQESQRVDPECISITGHWCLWGHVASREKCWKPRSENNKNRLAKILVKILFLINQINVFLQNIFFISVNHIINTMIELNFECYYSISCLGIMNYGSLLTTNKGGMFLLRVVQNQIHVVEITDDVMKAYDMEKLMLLPSQNKNETLRKYLHKISATIKVSLLFC